MAEPKPEPLSFRPQIEARLQVLREARSVRVKDVLVMREQVTNAEQSVSAIEGGIRELEKLLTTIPTEPAKEDSKK